MRTKSIALIMFLVLFFLQVAVGSAETATTSESITINIGATPYNPPFESLDSAKGDFSGFEVELLNEICKRLRANCRFKPVLAYEIIDSLTYGKIDIAITGLIKPQVVTQKNLIFSVPYAPSFAQFMVLQNSPFNTASDLNNKSIGIRKTVIGQYSAFHILLTNLYHGSITLNDSYVTTIDLIDGLNKGEVAAVLANEATLEYWNNNSPGTYKLLDKPIDTLVGYRIISVTRNMALMTKINQIIAAMFADGSWQTIYNRYFMTQ